MNTKRIMFLVVALIMCLSFVLVGCNSTPATSPDQSGDATTDEPSKDTDNSNDYPNGLSFAYLKSLKRLQRSTLTETPQHGIPTFRSQKKSWKR